MNWTTIDPEQMYSSANHTAACLGELESHLKALVGTQDELQAAVTGATGTAIYNALGNSYQRGVELANFLQNIVDNMQNAGVKLDGADLDAQGMINFEMGADGAVDAGVGTGTWDNWTQNDDGTRSAVVEQVDTKSWA
ncbi:MULTISPECIES: WXG100 family type VII secretion target [Nocardia]|uniref:WXG100 family type VII secretion target n=1 Tax=Nocardia TaxID=1817 RepID=UPI001894C629|nr:MULTISPECIES: WXG100 family type VII secretion target [Nocardia]MBF6351338.1 WXG100 family type VII secretion target [Nocardia flavorosea]